MKYKKVLSATLPNRQSARLRTFLYKVFRLLNLPNGYIQADPQET